MGQAERPTYPDCGAGDSSGLLFVNEQNGTAPKSCLVPRWFHHRPVAGIYPVTESIALPPDARDCIMSKSKTAEQRWHEQSEAAKDEAAKLPYGKLKSQLLPEGPSAGDRFPYQSVAIIAGSTAAQVN
jgi:hypothetical protein